MSQTLASSAVALLINANNPAWVPGTYVEPLAISNADGTAPTVTNSAPTVASAAITPNTGTTFSNTFPYLLTIDAVAVGTTDIQVLADGVPNLDRPTTVTALPDEGVAGNPTLAVTTAPTPPAA